MSQANIMARSQVSGSLDLGALYSAHAAFLTRTVARLTGAGSHVDDVIQEVFLIAHRKRESLAEHAEPRAWLYRTAQHVVKHHRRSIARRIRLTEAAAAVPPSPASDRPDQQLERQRHGDAIRDIVRTLPDKQREVFVLYELEQLSGEDIAGLVGVPVGTVWTRLHHARKRFKELWVKRHGERS